MDGRRQRSSDRARADKGDGLSSMLGASAMAHIVLVGGVRVRAGVVVRRREQAAGNDDADQPRRPGRPERRRPGDARRPDHSAGRTRRSEEADRAGASAGGEDAGDDRADQGAAEEDARPTRSTRRIRRARGRRRARRFRRARASPRPARRARVSACRPAAAAAAASSKSSNFCCPEYLATMAALIKANWNNQQGADGLTHMRFVIQKDGRIVDITVEQSSGVADAGFFRAPRADTDEVAAAAGAVILKRRSRSTCISNTRVETTT